MLYILFLENENKHMYIRQENTVNRWKMKKKY